MLGLKKLRTNSRKPGRLEILHRVTGVCCSGRSCDRQWSCSEESVVLEWSLAWSPDWIARQMLRCLKAPFQNCTKWHIPALKMHSTLEKCNIFVKFRKMCDPWKSKSYSTDPARYVCQFFHVFTLIGQGQHYWPAILAYTTFYPTQVTLSKNITLFK